MSTAEPSSQTEQTIFRQDVRAFRERAIANQYALIRVRSCSKCPLAREWQQGESLAALSDVGPEALNTGLLLAGLRCIDVDVDDPQLVSTILDQARRHLPTGALIRSRANSPRVAILFRAAEGQPRKRSTDGPKGKIEVLGVGQQVVVHGLHTSGAPLNWLDGRGPDTVSLSDLPAVSEQEIDTFLSACRPLLGHEARPGDAYSLDREPADLASLPPAVESLNTASIPNDLSAGIEVPHWFVDLTAEEKKALVKACLQALDNRISDPRDTWLRVLFSLGDAERLGCPDAPSLALEWSRQGASWTGEVDFEKAWGSCKPKPGGVTVGTLLSMACDAGLDVSQWRDLALARSQAASAVATASISSLSPQPNSPRALRISALPSIPPKRQWLHGIDLIRGAVSLLVAPGGRGKSSWLVTLSLACASGRPLLGAHVFGGPLRVLLISAEDPVAEVTLRIRAAMQHHGLTDADVPGLYVVGADCWGQSLLCVGRAGPMLNQTGWDALSAELDQLKPDVLILDPLMSVMGGASQNDNAAAALFMGQLVSVAAKRRLAVMLAHHASKGRDPISAESAMGAASFVNLSRIALGIEPLAEKDAGGLGLPPWNARHVFRVVGTKHNLSPASENDRWFRLISVAMSNAEPPTYPKGDKVGVVEVFQPGCSAPKFPPDMIRDALIAVDGASIPLSPSKRATGRWAVPAIEQAIAPHRGGRSSETEAKAVLDHLIRSTLLKVEKVKISRSGGRSDERDGLVLTSAGKHAAQNQPPQPPQSPATSVRDDAGGAPSGPRNAQGGMGEMRGAAVAGTRGTNSSSTAATEPPAPQVEATEVAASTAASEAQTAAPEPSNTASEMPSEPIVQSSSTEGCRSASKAATPSPPPTFDEDLTIPDFLDRRKSGSPS